MRFPPFLLATVELIPTLFMEVYPGYVAKYVTKSVANVSTPSTLHHVLTIGGFLLCLVLMISIARIALGAIEEAEAEISTDR